MSQSKSSSYPDHQDENSENRAALFIQEQPVKVRIPIEYKLLKVIQRSVVTEFSLIVHYREHDASTMHEKLDLAIDNVAEGFRKAITLMKK